MEARRMKREGRGSGGGVGLRGRGREMAVTEGGW